MRLLTARPGLLLVLVVLAAADPRRRRRCRRRCGTLAEKKPQCRYMG